MKTILITDSQCDLPISFIEEYDIPFLGSICNFKGLEIEDDLGKTLSYKEFYSSVRAGEMPTTHQINPYRYETLFEKYVQKGNAVLYIGVSSALSGSLNSARMAKEELEKRYPQADITVIDSLSASLGQGLIVYYAQELLKNGHSKTEVIDWVEDNKLKVNHWFTVDDLNHLRRGGRISNISAFIGTLLSFKPILKVNNEGKLIPVDKVRGRNKAILTLFNLIKERIVKPEEQVIFISHGDCVEEAEKLKDLIANQIQVKGFIVNNIGPAVGTHAGPGTIALFFLGEKR